MKTYGPNLYASDLRRSAPRTIRINSSVLCRFPISALCHLVWNIHLDRIYRIIGIFFGLVWLYPVHPACQGEVPLWAGRRLVDPVRKWKVHAIKFFIRSNWPLFRPAAALIWDFAWSNSEPQNIECRRKEFCPSRASGSNDRFYLKRQSSAPGLQRLQRLRLGERFYPSSFDIRLLIGNNTDHPNAAALILGAGVTDGYDLLNLVFLDESVDHRIQFFEFFSGFKYF